METSLHSTLITDQNRLIVTTERGLEDMIVRVLQRIGISTPARPEPEMEYEEEVTEVTSDGAKRILKAKGYKVTSYPGLMAVLDAHKIKGEKKGKNNWYQIKDIEAIPRKN